MSELAPTAFASGRWPRVLAVLLGVKAVYAGAVAALIAFGADFEAERAAQILAGWFPAGWSPAPRGIWERHFATWDAEHYLYLSAAGYSAEARSIAFYPLWPLAIRAGAALTGLSHVASGLLLANLCSLVGWLVFHRVAARRWGEVVADAALAMLVVFPGSLFFQFVYSESLFFLLLMVLWWGLERRHWSAAGFAALLLPLARGVGVFAVLPLAWHVARERGWGAGFRRRKVGTRPVEGGHKPGDREAENQKPNATAQAGEPSRSISGSGAGVRRSDVGISPWTLLAAPVWGWGLYLGLMAHWTGNPWAGVEAQRFWGVHAMANLWDLPKFVAGYFEVSDWHAFRGSVLDRVGFLLLVYTLPVQWRMGKDLLAWTLMLGVLPAMSGTFTSFVRFEACAFPLFLGLAGFFTRLKWKWPGASFGLLCLGLHGVLLWRFLNYRWAG